jgi:sugar (pentulose or hexulose) kinase
VFDCPVVTLVETEGAALGAAIQALAAADRKKTVNEWSSQLVAVNATERIEPQKNSDFDYGAAMRKQMELTRTLADGGFL